MQLLPANPTQTPGICLIQILSDIPNEFVQEYNLLAYTRDRWVYFEIWRGVYGLPQPGMLSNKLLEKRLNKAGYYQCPTTPGLWLHKWRPILFCLIVDDFGIEYVGKRHADHLRDILLKHYELTQDWSGSRLSGIDLTWDYTNRTCCLSINNYIKNLLLKWGHTISSKPQYAPFCHAPIIYGAKQKFANSPAASPKLDDTGIKRLQAIVGALIYYGRAVDNKLLVALSKLGSTQAAATELTKTDLSQILDYLST